MADSIVQIHPKIVKICNSPLSKDSNSAKKQNIGNCISPEDHNNTALTIIRGDYPIIRKKAFEQTLLVTPIYNCGFSLATIAVDSNRNVPFVVQRKSRCLNSAFSIQDLSQKGRNFSLISNFMGNKYNLYEAQELLVTISFQIGICGNYPTRKYAFYYLTQGNSYQSLSKIKKEDDLEVLYLKPENHQKIKVLSNESPRRGHNGKYYMNFARNNVNPAVENSVVIDSNRQACMEMVKITLNAFEIGLNPGIPRVWGIALALASLDFKIGVE